MLLLLSHHGFGALRCADLLGEGLEVAIYSWGLQVWDVTALIFCTVVVIRSREADGILVL